VPAQRARNAPAVHAPKQSLVRSAIVRLLHQPALATMLQPPYRFALLRQPGVALLADMVALVRQRPEITTGALLEHFSDREEAVALQKLATQTLPGEEALWRDEFADLMAPLEKQVAQQRIDELQETLRNSGFAALSVDEKNELLELQGLRPRS
jgi:DNA primase